MLLVKTKVIKLMKTYLFEFINYLFIFTKSIVSQYI